MGIFQTDLIVKTIIELGMEELKENMWLFEKDIFKDLLTNQYLVDKYGQDYINGAKAWFLNNNIEVYQAVRKDGLDFPCVTISTGQSNEDEAEITLGQNTTETEQLDPQDINQPIPFVVNPFTADGYTQSTGEVECPEETDVSVVSAGMYVVDMTTSEAFEVIRTKGDSIFIAEGSDLQNLTVAVVPQYQYWTARRERTSMREQMVVGCHVADDVNSLIYLFNIISYILFRWNEALLEAFTFDVARFGFSEYVKGTPFAEFTQESLNRYVTINGLVRHTWLKAPKRTIETAILQDTDYDHDEFVAAGGADGTVVTPAGIRVVGHRTPGEMVKSELGTALWKGDLDK